MTGLVNQEKLKIELFHFEEGRIYALDKWNKIMRIMTLETSEKKDELFIKIKEDTLKQIEFYRSMIDTRKSIISKLEGQL